MISWGPYVAGTKSPRGNLSKDPEFSGVKYTGSKYPGVYNHCIRIPGPSDEEVPILRSSDTDTDLSIV
jgi:hypothetical protein